MASRTARIDRHTGALSKEKIVEAAIALLDAGGESALTFRALAARLATGSGAIYWHVADKNELLGAAATAVVARVMIDVAAEAEPKQVIRTIALRLFDEIDAHPWIGGQLSREPWGVAMLQVFEGLGGSLHALGVPEAACFDAWSTLVNFIFGVAGQNAANARLNTGQPNRTAFLASVAARWARLDPADYPFVHQMAGRIGDHDDREQFLAGIDLILAGIGTTR